VQPFLVVKPEIFKAVASSGSENFGHVDESGTVAPNSDWLHVTPCEVIRARKTIDSGHEQ